MNLIRMEFYQILHNKYFYAAVLLILVASFLTLPGFENQVGIVGNERMDALRVFTTMLLMSGIWIIGIGIIGAFFAGQDIETPSEKITLAAGHSRSGIFAAKVISFLVLMNVLMLFFPLAGLCIELSRIPFYMGVRSDIIGIYIIRVIILTILINCSVFSFILLLRFTFQKAGITVAITALTLFSQYVLVGITAQKGITLSCLPFVMQQYSVLVNTTLRESVKIAVTAFFYTFVFLCAAYCFFFRREIK